MTVHVVPIVALAVVLIWIIVVAPWFILLIVSALPWVFGYRGTASLLLMTLLPALGFWFWGFSTARRGRRFALGGMMKHKTERLVLFVAAVIAAVVMVAGAHHYEVARRGEEVLYLAIGLTIRRQGYRVGGKHLETWEWIDELKYGALGYVLVMLLIAGAIIATGDVVGPIGLTAVVAPMGMIALSDEPRYTEEERYLERFLIRMYRRLELGELDEAW